MDAETMSALTGQEWSEEALEQIHECSGMTEDERALSAQAHTLKTLAGWNESGVDLDHYLKVGDLVDQAFADWWLDVMPPACMRGGCLQIGEAASHDAEGHTRYSTLKHTEHGWQFVGDCRRGQVEL